MKFLTLFLSLIIPPAVLTAKPQVAAPSTTESREQVGSSTELAAAKKELGEMLKRYTEKHPAVIKQRQKIKALEKAASAPAVAK